MPDRKWIAQWLFDLHRLAVDARLDRSALLAGIPGALTGAIRIVPTSSEQCLVDLHFLAEQDEVGRPIVRWLCNARSLARGKPDVARRFADALQSLGEQVPPLPAAPGNALESGTVPLPRIAGLANLLIASHRIVPFYLPGRAELLSDLDMWCDSRGLVSVRLIVGRGGMGKTRLMIEALGRADSRGWYGGFLRLGARQNDVDDLLDGDRATLIAIDYAERRSDLGELLSRLSEKRHVRSAPLRVVLLAREVGDWWKALVTGDRATGELLGEVVPIELGAPVSAGPARHAMFQHAATAFAEHLQKPVPTDVPPLDDPRFERALYVHMAALATVERIPFTASTLMEEVLNHEERLWLRDAPKDDSARRLWRQRTRRVVTALTLIGGAPGRAEAQDLIARAGGQADDTTELLLRDLYPGDAHEPGSLRGLAPDLLGEAMTYRTLKAEDTLASAFLRSALAGAGPEALQTAFTVLGHVSEEHPEAAAWIRSVLDDDLGSRAVPALRAARTVGRRTAHAPLGRLLARTLEASGTAQIAAMLHSAGIPYETISLAETAIWACRALLSSPQLQGDDARIRRWRAVLSTELGARLGVVGDQERALDAARSAVTQWRSVAERDPAARVHLSDSLNSLGVILSRSGQPAAALEASLEALSIARSLPDDAGLPPSAIAEVLSNLVVRMAELSRPLDEARYGAEAVAEHRRLEAERPGAFAEGLARSLNNLSNALGKLDRHAEALAAAEEALTIRRHLAESDPDAHEPVLVETLNNTSNALARLERFDEALILLQECVARRTKLAATHFEAFGPGLSGSLRNLGALAANLGNDDLASEAFEDSVRVARRLVESNFEAFARYLAVALDNWGHHLTAIDRPEDALGASKELVPIYRRLATDHPETYAPQLAFALDHFGMRLAAAGRHEEALAVTEEAVRGLRGLAAKAPEAYAKDLAIGLRNWSLLFWATEQSSSALDTNAEALAVYRGSTGEPTTSTLQGIEQCLSDRRVWLAERGRVDEARATAEEQRVTLRALSTREPGHWQLRLAMHCFFFGEGLLAEGHVNEAVETLQEAADAFANLPAERLREVADSELACRQLLAVTLLQAGRADEALPLLNSVVCTYRSAAAGDPSSRAALAGALTNLGNALDELGRHQEAIESAREAIRLYSESDPEAGEASIETRAGLGNCYHNLVTIHGSAGQFGEALESADRAVEVRRTLADGMLPSRTFDLAHSLWARGNTLFRLDRVAEAHAALAEASSLLRGVAREIPEVVLPVLLRILRSRAVLLLKLGSLDEAFDAARESGLILAHLQACDPEAFAADVAAHTSMVELFQALTAAEDAPE